VASGLLSALKSKLRRRRGANSPSPLSAESQIAELRAIIAPIIATTFRNSNFDYRFADQARAKAEIADMVIARLYGHVILNTSPTIGKLIDSISSAFRDHRRGLCESDTSRWPS
jgi:hypothetical protein